MGAGGVKLGKETRSFSLVKENNLVTNCKIHDIAFDQKSQVPAITLAGNGNSARNNEIYNTPHFAVKMKYANNCITEKNNLDSKTFAWQKRLNKASKISISTKYK